MDIFSSFALKVFGMPVRPGISSALPAGGQVLSFLLAPFSEIAASGERKGN